MKINLVIEDKKGKNLLFITDTNQALTLDEAIVATRNKTLENTHVVNEGTGIGFIRSNPNETGEDNLDALTLSFHQLEELLKDYAIATTFPALQEYEKGRQENIKKEGTPIYIDGDAKKTKEQVFMHIEKYKSEILEASNKQNIDPKILTAILIDEYLRMGPNDWFDWRAKLGINTSVGIAQIKVETARNIIQFGYYNPNPDDPNLSKDEINQTSRNHIHQYLTDPKHSIYFAAAVIRTCKESWKTTDSVKLASLYSDFTPKTEKAVKVSERGTQVGTEFYEYANELFSN